MGDAEFQKKSSERLAAFRAGGATILMVSHNLPAIGQHAVWLDHGQVRAVGPVEEVASLYQAEIVLGLGDAALPN